MRRLRPGLRVRLKSRAQDGLGAEGTIVETRAATAVAIMDDHAIREGDWYYAHEGEVEAPYHDWAVLRDQTPNPDHRAALPPTLH